MIPPAWNDLLAPHVPLNLVTGPLTAAVNDTLSGLSVNEAISTSELVERLYPAASCRGEIPSAARKRLFSALLALVTTPALAPYATRGERQVRKRYGRERVERPWRWHRAQTVEAPALTAEQRTDLLRQAEEAIGNNLVGLRDALELRVRQGDADALRPLAELTEGRNILTRLIRGQA